MSNYSKLNSNVKNHIFPIVTISFILLVLLGLIEGHSTLHQKVFKSYLLCWFDTILFAVYAIQVFVTKTSYEKKRKFFLYFVFYFVCIFENLII